MIKLGDDEDSISPKAVDLIDKLLNMNPAQRLGANGAQEVKNHPFFDGNNLLIKQRIIIFN